MAEEAKRNSRTWVVFALLAVAAAGVFFYMREQEAQRCRRALVYSERLGGYGGEIDAALALAAETNAQTARECYEKGLISTPP